MWAVLIALIVYWRGLESGHSRRMRALEKRIVALGDHSPWRELAPGIDGLITFNGPDGPRRLTVEQAKEAMPHCEFKVEVDEHGERHVWTR